MDPRRLPPAVLLALGLHGCQCSEQHLGPCLSIAPADPPDPPRDAPAGPCLVPPPPPEPPIGPCLSPPRPPDPPVGPPDPPVGPCLEPMPPDPPDPPDPPTAPCLDMPPPDEAADHPCLSMLPPRIHEPEENKRRNNRADPREAVLRRVTPELPPDVAAALHRKS